MYQDPSIALKIKIELNDKISRAEFYAYIAWGANPNHQDFFKRSLLHIALTSCKPNKKQYLERISWLLDVGADIDIKDEKGQAPRQLAESLHITEAVELFNAHESKMHTNDQSSQKHA